MLYLNLVNDMKEICFNNIYSYKIEIFKYRIRKSKNNRGFGMEGIKQKRKQR